MSPTHKRKGSNATSIYKNKRGSSMPDDTQQSVPNINELAVKQMSSNLTMNSEDEKAALASETSSLVISNITESAAELSIDGITEQSSNSVTITLNSDESNLLTARPRLNSDVDKLKFIYRQTEQQLKTSSGFITHGLNSDRAETNLK